MILSFFFLVGCQETTSPESPKNEEAVTEDVVVEKSEEDPPKKEQDIVENNEEDLPENEQVTLEDESVKLIFLGDTMMAGKVADVMKDRGDAYPLSEFMPILQTADLVIANLETAVGTSGRTLAKEKKYAFQTDPARFTLFQPLRDKILFSLANNHGLDAPLEETMLELDKLGFPYIGIGNNSAEAFRAFYQEINGIKLAVLGVSRVMPTHDWAAGEGKPGMASAYSDQPLLNYIKEWEKKADYVVVYIHWGEELADQPNAHQEELEKKMKEAGANIIIGSHPHVIQGMKWEGAKQFTAFSLGNFVFTTSTTPKANDTLALEINLTKQKIEEIRVWPGQVRFGLVRSLVQSDEKNRIFQRVIDLSTNIGIDTHGRITNLYNLDQ